MVVVDVIGVIAMSMTPKESSRRSHVSKRLYDQTYILIGVSMILACTISVPMMSVSKVVYGKFLISLQNPFLSVS